MTSAYRTTSGPTVMVCGGERGSNLICFLAEKGEAINKRKKEDSRRTAIYTKGKRVKRQMDCST